MIKGFDLTRGSAELARASDRNACTFHQESTRLQATIEAARKQVQQLQELSVRMEECRRATRRDNRR